MSSYTKWSWHDNPLIDPYKGVKYEVSEENGIILRGNRFVMPKSLQIKAIQIAHEKNLGVEKCKSLLRMNVHWLSMNSMVSGSIRDCTAGKVNSRDLPLNPLKTSELPENVWAEIAIDFFGPLPSGERLLVITDLYSRFPLVVVMKNTNAEAVINRL